MTTGKLEGLYEVYSFFMSIETTECELTKELKQEIDKELAAINAALKEA